jgi:hypothetical protein
MKDLEKTQKAFDGTTMAISFEKEKWYLNTTFCYLCAQIGRI